jgi:CBS domain-containing protein
MLRAQLPRSRMILLGADEFSVSCSVMDISGTVNEILSRKGSNVWSVTPETTVFDAIKLMADKNVGALPVLDRERLAGIISERDYTRKVILKGRSSKETPAKDVMSSELVVAKPDDPIVGCMRLMAEKRVRHLPVVEGEKIVGIISIGDLVKWIISAQTAAIDQLERYITGDYPA